jgi:hypothetical protein
MKTAIHDQKELDFLDRLKRPNRARDTGSFADDYWDDWRYFESVVYWMKHGEPIYIQCCEECIVCFSHSEDISYGYASTRDEFRYVDKTLCMLRSHASKIEDMTAGLQAARNTLEARLGTGTPQVLGSRQESE